MQKNVDDVTSKRAKNAINAAIELFHKRWVLRIIWELRAEALTFRQLQEACSEVSPSVLNSRLRELRETGLVGHVGGEGYQLSPHGRSLLASMRPMISWAVEWHTPDGRRAAKKAAKAVGKK